MIPIFGRSFAYKTTSRGERQHLLLQPADLGRPLMVPLHNPNNNLSNSPLVSLANLHRTTLPLLQIRFLVPSVTRTIAPQTPGRLVRSAPSGSRRTIQPRPALAYSVAVARLGSRVSNSSSNSNSLSSSRRRPLAPSGSRNSSLRRVAVYLVQVVPLVPTINRSRLCLALSVSTL